MNVGIIGAGNFSANHIKAIEQTQGLKLHAVSRRNIQELRRLRSLYQVKGYSDYRQLIEDNEIQIVLISTPHHLHGEIVEQAANKGKHIMVEKPIGSTWEDCERIHRAVSSNGVKFLPAHIGRFTPAFLAAENYLKNNGIGTFLAARATSFSHWKTNERKPWHLTKATGGGYLLTLGVHQIDLLCALIPSKVVKVYSSLQNLFFGDETDDCGSAVLHFGNGVIANLQMAGFHHGTNKVETEIFGKEGMLKVNFSKGAFISRQGKWEALKGSCPKDWMEKALRNEWKNFFELLKDTAPPKITLEQSMHVMEIIFAIQRSSERGCEVRLPFRHE